MDEEQSWHPDGADLPWWAVILLALGMVLPAMIVLYLLVVTL